MQLWNGSCVKKRKKKKIKEGGKKKDKIEKHLQNL
jgi:hypothetical protein